MDDLAIPAIDYSADFEDGADGWISEGWLLTDNQLQQRWLVQAMLMDDNRIVGLERPVFGYITDSVTFDLDLPAGSDTAVIAVSALAPVTTEQADYSITVRQRE